MVHPSQNHKKEHESSYIWYMRPGCKKGEPSLHTKLSPLQSWWPGTCWVSCWASSSPSPATPLSSPPPASSSYHSHLCSLTPLSGWQCRCAWSLLLCFLFRFPSCCKSIESICLNILRDTLYIQYFQKPNPGSGGRDERSFGESARSTLSAQNAAQGSWLLLAHGGTDNVALMLH